MKIWTYLRKKNSNQKGFTLVELIVTLSVFSICLVVAGNMLFFGNNMFAKTEVKNSEKYIGDNVYKYMNEIITYATKLEVIDAGVEPKTPKYSKVMYIGTTDNTGNLVLGKRDSSKDSANLSEYSADNIFSANYYGNYKVEIAVQVLDKVRLKLTVTVKLKGSNDVVYSTGAVIKNLNLVNSESQIAATTNSSTGSEVVYTNPVISYEEDVTTKTAYSPLELRGWMMETNSYFLDGKGLPPDYGKVTGVTTTNSNDAIRSYVVQWYYKKEPFLGTTNKETLYEYWPNFSEYLGYPDPDGESVKKVDEIIKEKTGKVNSLYNYLQNKDLKVQAYICTTTGLKDGSCYIYIPSAKGNQWATQMVFNHDDGYWYYNCKGNFFINDRHWENANQTWNPNNPINDKTANGVWDIIKHYNIENTDFSKDNPQIWIQIPKT